MSTIWAYLDQAPDLLNGNRYISDCVFCTSKLEKLETYDSLEEGSWLSYAHRIIKVCERCGWWDIRGEEQMDLVSENYTYYTFASGSLKNLDLTDISLPIEEVRDFLTANYRSRFTLHHKLFEETVASVFGSLGFQSRVTGKSGDNGIDVLLEGKEKELIGVQVKRYKNSIKVEQIRSFAGALVLEGLTKGIFVTTSSFQQGSYSTSEKYITRGIDISLVNGTRFYDELKLAQRDRYAISDDFAFFNVIKLARYDKTYSFNGNEG